MDWLELVKAWLAVSALKFAFGLSVVLLVLLLIALALLVEHIRLERRRKNDRSTKGPA